MGALVKLVDAILFLFLTVIAIAAPLIDSQTVLPTSLFPDVLVDLKNWYAHHYDDYLFTEKPHFFAGIVWLQLLFQWPLALLNLYAILGSKSWFNTTSLIYGVSVLTSTVAILSEMISSGKASDKLLMLYWPFFGLGVLATLRGLIPQSGKTAKTVGDGPEFSRKKKA
ncbi:Transmembrane protein [Parasponia andersonii]|uniref:Transmembrane protein n=1 Tax=Parasponia andersonii TaxID=3476 RepID=A0A2P5D613_PARAD|nr:Transmembrane protein [Parasponia andersonii]